MVRRTSLHKMLSVRSILAVSGLLTLGIAAACSAGGGTGSSGTNAAASSSSGAGGGTAGMGGTGGEGGSAGMGGQGGSAGGPMGCKTNTDCANDPKGTLCNTMTGQCAECIPSGDPGIDDCGIGQYCNEFTGQCEPGCTGSADCAMLGAKMCNLDIHKCVGCIENSDCGPGSVCQSSTCVTGCAPDHPCQAGYTCCGSSCFDLADNENNCGFCGNVCPITYKKDPNDPNSPEFPLNGMPLCSNGLCGVGTCNQGYENCNQDPKDGCEWNVLQDGACSCVPGQKQSCYQGQAGTAGIGACKSGTQTCKADGSGWSACVGQVLPKPEICGNTVDDDCNGIVDDDVDADGDGWTSCGGDCCDSYSPLCKNPKLNMPGGYEYPNDGQDNDCDPTTPDVPVPCSTSTKVVGVTGEDIAKAMDLCVFTVANPPPGSKPQWGVISAEQFLSDGAVPTPAQLTNIQDKQSAILDGYGSNVVPNVGPTFAALSTGVMRDQDDAGYAGTSTDLGVSSSPPAAYLLANGGKLPSTPNCMGTACPVGSGAKDPVLVRLKIRTPLNAKSFTYDFRFFSSEYWTFQCTTFNDFFLALYQSTWKPDPMANPPQLPLPLDKNVAVDEFNHPISVNNGFFDVCAPKECNPCPGGFMDLAGTGMQLMNTGGGTKWLKNDVPIVPGETITLDLVIFDVQDPNLDSLVLLDNFHWNGDVLQGLHE